MRFSGSSSVSGPDIVVPGHGPVGGPELLRQTGDYLRFVEDAAGEADRQGQSALEAARGLKLGSPDAGLPPPPELTKMTFPVANGSQSKRPQS